ncbi:hypothetical protein C8R42DRAFT_67366 [Lentinula raphanica]|nr:hypothetical protein C8R42DRAFT_67366 [Lentinula raphanica]
MQEGDELSRFHIGASYTQLMTSLSCFRTISASELASRRNSLGKRAQRSPSPSISTGPLQAQEESKTYQRQSKRHCKSHLIPSYDAPPDEHVLQAMGKSNPMNRRLNKMLAKKERKRDQKLARHLGGSTAGGMEVDDSSNLGLTFMA